MTFYIIKEKKTEFGLFFLSFMKSDYIRLYERYCIPVSSTSAWTGSKTFTSKFSKSKRLSGESTARKGPIGRANNQREMKPPTD